MHLLAYLCPVRSSIDLLGSMLWVPRLSIVVGSLPRRVLRLPDPCEVGRVSWVFFSVGSGVVVVVGCAGVPSPLGWWVSGSGADPAADCDPGVAKSLAGGVWESRGVLGCRLVFDWVLVVDGVPDTQPVSCRRCLWLVVL